MRFTYTTAEVDRLDQCFICHARRKNMNLDKCLDDYLAANAFENKRSACYRCPQGRDNREGFASVAKKVA